MRTKKSAAPPFVAASLLALLISGPVQATSSNEKVRTFFNAQGELTDPEVVGKATLKRSKQGVSLSLHTTHLGPGHAYTIWWVIFNNPKACTDAGCGIDESDFVNPKVDASIMNATGRVADHRGKGWFSAFLPAGFIHTNTPAGGLRQVSGPGLQNVKGAEIHVVVRCHGEWVGPFADTEQLSTFNGDCNADTAPQLGGCYDAQFAVFPPKGHKSDDARESD